MNEFTEPFDIQDTYVAQDEALKYVWDDAALDVYNEPDARSSA